MRPQPEPPQTGRPLITPLKSVLAAGIVVSLCAALSFGSSVRDRVDSQRAGIPTSLGGMVASLDRGAGQKEAGGYDLDRYYGTVEEILKAQYVEPIKDENKLAIGAVHGMITSLGDPRSEYMDKDAFKVFLAQQEGHFAGIGADFAFQPTGVDLSADDQTSSDTDPTSDIAATRIPRLVINAVVPGGPADKAGVKPGDWIDSVDGHWVIDPIKIAHYRKLAVAHQLAVTKHDLTPAPEYDSLRREIRDEAENAIMPARAFTILSMGDSGKVTVKLMHEGQPERTVIIGKADAPALGNTDADGVIKLRFGKDAPEFFGKEVAGKPAMIIDLRGEPEGYFDSMLACLKLVAPAGNYGTFETQRKGENPTALKLSTGNANPPKLTLLVDGSVRGPAAIFALALSSKGLANLQGSEVAEDRSRMLVEAMPDSSGYTLVTGEYLAQPPAAPTQVKGGKP